MEKKFNIVVGEDGTVKLPDAVLEKLEVKPGEEVRFEVDDNFYAVRLLSRIEAERLDYLNWMHKDSPFSFPMMYHQAAPCGRKLIQTATMALRGR